MNRRLTCYQISDPAPPIVPGQAERLWMDATRNRFAYRCLPLTIANSMGWELLCPEPVTAEWNGGPGLGDVAIEGADPAKPGHFAQSHFGHGVLTFQTGYLFRTASGTGLWVRGVPNLPKDGIAPLDGVVETDWLSFSFTMNWMFTRPGRVSFAAGEPFCFITPLDYRAIEPVVPEIVPIAAEPKVKAAYEAYAEKRSAFNANLAASDPATLKEGWQKWYMRGTSPAGGEGNPAHLSKLRLAAPVPRGPERLSRPRQSRAKRATPT